jgi:hypothetical protein
VTDYLLAALQALDSFLNLIGDALGFGVEIVWGSPIDAGREGRRSATGRPYKI